MESLPAVLARIRPRVRVDEQVRGERGGALEAFAADFTAEASLLDKKYAESVWKASKYSIQQQKCLKRRPVYDGKYVTACSNVAQTGSSASVFILRPVPASAPLCAGPSSLRVRRFSRRSHTQTAASRCVIAAHEPPAREVWRTPCNI